MLDEFNKAITGYQSKWKKLSQGLNNCDYFINQRPTAVAWKMSDREELMRYFTELRDICDQIHFGWVNERWLVTMHLKNQKLADGIQIIKLMERRPGSSDAVGLDHLDFWSNQNEQAEQILAQESKLKWSRETNNPHCSWVSIWFDGTEAKLRTDTVLDPCIAEMQDVKGHVLSASSS